MLTVAMNFDTFLILLDCHTALKSPICKVLVAYSVIDCAWIIVTKGVLLKLSTINDQKDYTLIYRYIL